MPREAQATMLIGKVNKEKTSSHHIKYVGCPVWRIGLVQSWKRMVHPRLRLLQLSWNSSLLYHTKSVYNQGHVSQWLDLDGAPAGLLEHATLRSIESVLATTTCMITTSSTILRIRSK